MARITVTQEDIDIASMSGEHHDTERCPVARAMRRRWPEATVLTYQWFKTEREQQTRKLRGMPAAATQFIIEFDRGQLVEPFSFEVAAR